MFGMNLRQWLIRILLLLLVIAVSYPGMFAHFSTRLSKMHMDTVSHLGNINWQNHFLLHEPGLVFNMGTFYPHSLATFFGPPMFGITPWFGLFKLFGLGMCSQFNLFIVFGFLIGAAGVFSLTLEISGKEKIYAFVAAVIYIVFNTQRSLFVWLPLFSTFFVPWTLLFFLRYLKNQHHRDLLLFLALAAAQFVTSVYLGIYLLVFFLPWMIFFALLFKSLSVRNLLKIAAGLVLVASLMLILYHPIVSSYDGVTSPRVYRPVLLLNISDLFTANRSFLYSQVLNLRKKTLFNWFPGVMVYILFFISGISFARARRWPWLAFIAAALLAVLSLQMSHLFWSSSQFWLLLTIFIGSHIRQRRQDPSLLLLALAFAGYLFIFFNFLPMGLPRQALPFSLLASCIPYFQRMCEYKRVFVILVPVMAVFAAHGLRMLGGRRRWLPLLVLGLIWLENFEPRIGNWGKTLRLDDRAPIYAAIPRQSDKVILEIPFFGGTQIWSLPSFFQSIYAYSTRFHWNFVVNGRDSFAPLEHQELARRATIPEIFKEENIAWLKRRYAVEYLVINWPLLTSAEALLAREHMPFLAVNGDALLDSAQATVIRLRERKEISVLERTYSAYHLRHRQLQVKLAQPYSIRASVTVGGRHWKEFKLEGNESLQFRVDPKLVQRDCALVSISFSRPVKLVEIALRK